MLTRMKLNLRPNKDALVEDELHNSCSGMEYFFVQMLNSGQFTDVKVISGDDEIPADKVVLAARVPFFNQALLHDNFEESTIHVPPEISLETLRLIIRYAYFQQPKVTVENAQALLEAAAFFQIGDLLDLCDKFVSKVTVLTVQNYFELYSYASGIGAKYLMEAIENFMAKHFVGIIHTQAFKRMSQKEVTSILRINQINGRPNEETYWDGLLRWINADADNRKILMPQMLGLVRLPNLSKDDIIMKVLPHPYIDKNPICREMVQDLLSYKVHPNNVEMKQKFEATFYGKHSWWERSLQHQIYVLYSNIPGNRSWNTMQVLQKPYSKWVQASIEGIPKEDFDDSWFFKVAPVEKTMYCVTKGNSIISYNTSAKTWSTIQDDRGRPINLSTLFLCCVNKELVACGFDGNDVRKTFMWYCYRPVTNSWQSGRLIVKNNLKWDFVGVCGVTNRKTDSELLCVHVECTRGKELVRHLYLIDLVIGQLIRRTKNKFLLSCPITSHNGKVFVLGYDGEEKWAATVKVYDATLDVWSSLPDMNVAGRGFRLVVANDCLYAIAGYDRGNKDILSVEYLDLTDMNPRWQPGPKLLDLWDQEEDVSVGHIVACQCFPYDV